MQRSLWHQLKKEVSGIRALETEIAEESIKARDRIGRAVRGGITFRAVSIALVLTWLSGYWVRQSEIIALACQGTEAVPAVPGTGALIVLLLFNVLAARTRRIRPLEIPELITVFLFVSVGTTMMGPGIGRFLIACTTAPFYYTSPAAPLEELARFIPAWMSPSDPAIHRWLYESSPTGKVPWEAWQVPMIAWTGFFLLFGGTLFCLMILFSEPWVDEERLVFPLVRLPLQIVDPEYSEVPFLKAKATWIGMGLALALNVVNIVRGVYFGGPSGGLRVDFGGSLTGAPWNALRPLTGDFRPELIGLGYLISTELSFSIWFFQLFNKLQAVAMSAAGYRLSGAPFAQEQGIGAYLVLGVILLWKGRHPFVEAWRSWIEGLPEDRADIVRTNRWALVGAAVGFLGVIVFCVAAGLNLWLALVYFAVLVTVSIVYGRLRAETGVPLIWAFPYGLAHKSIRYFVKSRSWIGIGPNYRSPTIYTMFIFLSRGYFPSMSGYGIEGLTLGEGGGVRKSGTFWLLLSAVGVGCLFSYYFHFVPYYEEGAVGLRGGLWGAGTARAEFAGLYRQTQLPTPPDVPRIIATLGGGGLIAFLSVMRVRFFGWPFHPLGYAMACSYGQLLWAPFFLVWVIKSVLLRYGGHQAYLSALPGFMGFALGHFIVAGAIWGTLGAALGGVFLRYGVWFG